MRNISHVPIFAVSTTTTRAAIHVQRISGNGIFSALVPHLKKPKTEEPLSTKRWPPANAQPVLMRSLICDKNHDIIDEVMISGFCGPHSFTGEDVIEIASHGNPLILAKIQTLLRSLGFRDALAGEFTERAFRNGKMDLTQAEALHEIITARSDLAIRLAHKAASGQIADAAGALRKQLIECLAYLEAHIDFAEDEVGTFDSHHVVPALQKIALQLESLAQTFDAATRARDGLRVCFAGKPNAGKSSLFNAILKKERAIVTDIPGTTRDILEEHFLFRNRDFVLLDTAGLRESNDVVERIGVERSNQQIKGADLVCLLVDASIPKSGHEAKKNMREALQEIHSTRGQHNILVVASKTDIADGNIVEAMCEQAKTQGSLKAIAASQASLDNVLNEFCNIYDLLSHTAELEHSTVLISARQRDCARTAAHHLREAIAAANAGSFPESIASLLMSGKNGIEEIVGVIAPNDVLETLFSHFCIGK